MKPYAIIAASLLTLISLAAAAEPAQPGKAADGLVVADAYARAVPPGQPNSAVFMTLTNTLDNDHALVGASSTAAEVVELHTHRMDDGMMRMRRVDRIDLPGGAQVELKPGGLHVMLIGLKRPLVAGDEVAVTLVLDDGSSRQITAPVRAIMP
jgi:periplasmic copper chaperone A